MQSPPDPLLAQLQDIHLPPPPSWWPPAPGWWVLVALLLLALAALGWWQWQRWRRNAFRRAAARECRALQQAFDQGADPIVTVQDLSNLLRRVARTAMPGTRGESQTGEAWLRFLDQTGSTGEFTRGPGRILATWPYLPPHAVAEEHPRAKVNAALRLAATWIQRI